jgi:hypothetical protein
LVRVLEPVVRNPLHTPSLEWALAHGQRGYLSFPLVWFTKKPTKDSNGLYDATADPDRIREMWSGAGRSNVGLRCGVTFDVVDVDAHHGGLDTLSDIVGGDTAVIPCGPVVRTPNGGAHLYYLPTGYGSHTAIAPGIDFKADGGYVVGVGSAIPEGSYAWHEQGGEVFHFDRPLVPLPKRFRDLIERKEHAAAPSAPTERPVDDPGPVRTGDGNRSPRYALAALENEARAVQHAPVGERNDQLSRSTYSLTRFVAGGELPAAVVDEVMTTAGRATGLTDAEIKATIESRFRKRGIPL